MEDRFEKKLKELLPYIIVSGVLFLLLPLLMGTKENAVTYVIQIGAFPLISLGCGFHYTFRKHKREILLCFIPTLFYALSALLYGMWRDSWVTVLIYMAAYFICAFLGMMLCDLLIPLKKKAGASAPKHNSNRPKRVNVHKHDSVQPASAPIAQDPSRDSDLDTSTTDDDIEAMLKAIRDRKSQ